MNRRTYIALLTSLLLGTSLGAAAEGQHPAKLSPEQIKHEDALKRLRMTKELISERHEQAKLLKDCREMGMDCSADGQLTLAPSLGNQSGFESQAEAHSPLRLSNGEPPPTEHSIAEITEMEVPVTSSVPELVAVQNKSAELKLGEKSQWVSVGDPIGEWKVIYISSTKVRIRNMQDKNNTRTLLLTW